MEPRQLAVSAVVVAAEVVAAAAAVFLVYALLRGLLGRVGAIGPLARYSGQVEGLRRTLRRVFGLLGAVLVAAILAVNGALLYRGADILEETRGWLAQVPRRFWVDFGVAVLQVLGLLLLAALVLRWLRRGIAAAGGWAKGLGQIRANDESIDAFVRSLSAIATNGAWLFVLARSAAILRLPDAVTGALTVLFKIYLTVTLGLLVVRGIDALVDSVEGLTARHLEAGQLRRFYERLRQLIPLAKRCLEYVIYVYVATLVALQVEVIAPLAPYGHSLVRVIGIFFLARVVIELAHLGVDELLVRRKDLPPETRQQRLTFAPLIRSSLKYIIFFGAAVLMLAELGVNPAPILAGAGIAGLAVGLGAQNLINDVVSGFFILFENHYLVGDFIETGGARGVVEAIDLRTTHVRNPNGQLHILRNGQIGEVVHHSKGYTHAVVQVGVAYESDLKKVFRVLEEVGRELASENEDVLEPTAVQGLEDFGESELLVRTVTRVKPGRHAPVARAMRARIKEAFDRNDIEIPYARRVLILKGEQGVEDLARALEAPASRDPKGEPGRP
jgi:small conductance mechanosensitive channel